MASASSFRSYCHCVFVRMSVRLSVCNVFLSISHTHTPTHTNIDNGMEQALTNGPKMACFTHPIATYIDSYLSLCFTMCVCASNQKNGIQTQESD